MNKVIIYGSKYGTTTEYAQELSKRIGVKAVSYKEIKDINIYDDIIYIGGLYAGGVCGMAKTMKKWNVTEDKKITIVTVGIADPKNQENKNHLKNGIKKQVSEEVYKKSKIFHLRGSIDYTNLGKVHRIMMGLIYKKAKNIPLEQQNAEIKGMIETYNKKVSFIDFNSLEAIIAQL